MMNTLQAHYNFNHAGSHAVYKKFKSEKIDNMPPVKVFKCPCSLCMKHKMKHLPRYRHPIDLSKALLASILYCYFSFYNVISVRGFAAVFDTICGSTRHPFTCCARSKRPPVQHLKFLKGTLSKHTKKVHVIRCDEGGELARSTELCKFLLDSDIILSTTGGYNSSRNGRGERPHQDYRKFALIMLGSNSNLSKSLW